MQLMAAPGHQCAAWANCSPCSSYSGAGSCKNKAAMARAMLLMSNSQHAVHLSRFSRASSRFLPSAPTHPLSTSRQCRVAKRTFLRRSFESSVEVGSEGVVDNLEDSLNRMRELVALAGGKAEAVDDASLMRFLKGFSLNVNEAAEGFAKHQEWEASFKPKGFILETEISNELNAKKSYLQGRDKEGRPISVILARNHVHNKEDFDEFRRFIVYSMDKALAASSTSADGKINAIIDLKGLGFKNLDSKAFIAGFDIYQSHYPECIEKLYMVNAPLIFNGLWTVVSSFINETTRKKIVFVANKKVEETLLSVIDTDQLPVEYGGAAELVLLQDAVVPGWPPVKQDPAS